MQLGIHLGCSQGQGVDSEWAVRDSQWTGRDTEGTLGTDRGPEGPVGCPPTLKRVTVAL